jgi:hypothetical protein
MRMMILKRALALSLLSVIAAIAVGCSCGSDEYAPKDACEKIAIAVNKVFTTCGATTESEIMICGQVCDHALTDCSERADVDACTTAIASISCDSAESRGYVNLSDCVTVFSNLKSSCSSSSAGDDDFDD